MSVVEWAIVATCVVVIALCLMIVAVLAAKSVRWMADADHVPDCPEALRQ